MEQIKQEVNYKYGTRYSFEFTVYDNAGNTRVYPYVVSKFFPADCLPFYSLRYYEETRQIRYEVLRNILYYLN